MQILSEGTLNSYDKFKENIFVHKKNQFKKEAVKKPVNLPFSFLKNILFLGAIGYGIYQFRDSITRNLRNNSFKAQLKSKFLPLTQQLILRTVFEQFTMRLSRLFHNQKLAPFDNKFSNHVYITQVQALLFKLQHRQNINQIYAKESCLFKFWVWQFRKEYEKIFINQLGDLVQIHYSSPLSFAGIGILGSFTKKLKLLQKSQEHARLSQLQNAENPSKNGQSVFEFIKGCKSINKLNSLFTTPAQNQQLIADCQSQIQKLQKDIIKQSRIRKKKYSDYQKTVK